MPFDNAFANGGFDRDVYFLTVSTGNGQAFASGGSSDGLQGCRVAGSFDFHMREKHDDSCSIAHISTFIMSYGPRPTSGLMRPSSGLGQVSNSQSSALQARINEKKLELEGLKQLRDLSAGLAGQMQQLEEKLQTLSDGTEAVAHVMANWNTVLRAVHMASSE